MSQYLRKEVVKMAAYTPGEQINNATKLNTNECAWGPAPGVLKALAKTPVDALRLYPSPMANKVREAASEVFEIDAEQVLVGNGSDDCLTVVMRSFLSKGDVVACPWPTYSLYDTLATIQGVDIVHKDWLEAPDKLMGAATASSGSGNGSSKKRKGAAAADGAAAGAAVLRLRAVGRLVRSKHVATADGGVCRGNAVGERGAEHGDRRDEQREQQRPAELERGGGQRGVRQVLAPPAGSVSGRERLRANRSPLALLGSVPPQEPPTQVT
jgi:hypothetical protein